MKTFRALGLALGAVGVLAVACGTAYAVRLARLWNRAVRATDPFDPAEPI